MRESVFTKRTICLISGANRGLGKSVALGFSDRFERSVFILLSRNVEQQDITEREMNSRNTVISRRVDFSSANKDDIEFVLNESLQGVNILDYEQVINIFII